MHVKLLLLITLLVACVPSPRPTQTPTPTFPLPSAQTQTPTQTRTATPAPPPTAAPPRTLTLCLPAEPQSLYRYARPEAGREDILAALSAGPIDLVNFQPRPVLLEKLPSVQDGDAVVNDVTLNAGEVVVDELGRVVTLIAGVTVNLLDGAQIVFDGATPITVPQLVVHFRIKPGAQWSDGAPLTAADSVFAFEVSASPDSFNPRRVLTERTAAYRALDEATVQWTGLPGFIDPDYARNFFAPLPRHRYAGLTPEQIADSDEANFNPLGWGPFVLHEWVRGDHLTLVRNDTTLIYRFTLDADCTVALAEVPGLIAHSVESTVLWHLDFNLAAEGRWSAVNTRRAIALCLDRSAFTPNVPATYLPAAHPLRATDVTAIPFDPAQGRVGLGGPFTFTLAFGASGEAIAQTIQHQLKNNCEIEVELQPLTRGEVEGDWPEGIVFGRRYDAALFAWDTGFLPPCPLWMSLEIASAENPGGANNTGYANAAFDEACRRARTTLDPAQAALYHAEAQRLWARAVPVVPLFFAERRAALQPGVQGFALETGSPAALWNIEWFSVMK